jgi:hypothetical protein
LAALNIVTRKISEKCIKIVSKFNFFVFVPNNYAPDFKFNVSDFAKIGYIYLTPFGGKNGTIQFEFYFLGVSRHRAARRRGKDDKNRAAVERFAD